jgi:hypothetical protein
MLEGPPIHPCRAARWRAIMVFSTVRHSRGASYTSANLRGGGVMCVLASSPFYRFVVVPCSLNLCRFVGWSPVDLCSFDWVMIGSGCLAHTKHGDREEHPCMIVSDINNSIRRRCRLDLKHCNSFQLPQGGVYWLLGIFSNAIVGLLQVKGHSDPVGSKIINQGKSTPLLSYSLLSFFM